MHSIFFKELFVHALTRFLNVLAAKCPKVAYKYIMDLSYGQSIVLEFKLMNFIKILKGMIKGILKTFFL